MSRLDPRSLLADTTFGVMRAYTRVYNRFHLPVISTARPFSFYRDIFFDGRSERTVLDELAGKTVVDVGCGLTPFVSDSAFQVCNAHGVNFYGVDPKLDDQFRFGAFDRFKVRATGGRGSFDRNAAYRERMLAAPAERIPLGNAQVDLIVSSWLLFVWIDDEAALARIFNEFHRLLQRGGEVRIYPQRAWRAQAIRYAPLRKELDRFSVRQQFKLSRAALPVTPAYMTVLRK